MAGDNELCGGLLRLRQTDYLRQKSRDWTDVERPAKQAPV